MASVNELPDGRWQIRAYLGRNANGKPTHRTRTIDARNRKTAQRVADDWQDDLRRSGYAGIGERATVDKVAERWLDRLRKRGDVEALTLHGYESHWRRDIQGRLGARQIDQVTTADIDAFYDELADRAPSAPMKVNIVLRGIWREAIRLGATAHSPLELAQLPTRRRPARTYPTLADVAAVVDAAHRVDPWRARFVITAVGTGARRGELASMRWSDVDTTNGTWLIDKAIAYVPRAGELIVKDPKTHKRRTVPLHGDVVRVVLEQMAYQEERAWQSHAELVKDPYLWSFSSDGSKPPHPDTLSKVVPDAARAAGVTARLHDMRHAFASFLINEGESVLNVQRLLGHASSVTTLSVYGHSDQAQHRKAIDRFDGMLTRKALGAAPEDRP